MDPLARSGGHFPVEKGVNPVQVDRVHLAAALLDYDAEDSNLDSAHSALLTPYRHLLATPKSPVAAQTDSPLIDTEFDDPHALTPGTYAASAPASQTKSNSVNGARPSSELERLQNDYRKSIGISVHGIQGVGNSGQTEAEEEELNQEWGLTNYFSQLGSKSQFGSEAAKSPSAATTSFLPFPSGIETLTDLELNGMETKSLPDLERSRAIASPLPEPNPPAAGRLRILERRADDVRLRTQSLGPKTALTLPEFGGLPSFTDSHSENFAMDMKGTKNPLLSPRYSIDQTRNTLTGTATHPTRPISRLSLAATSGYETTRNSFDLLDRAESSLEMNSEGKRPPSTLSVAPRPASALSLASSTFTSKFDPAVIAQQKAELDAERPVFTNKFGGQTPKIVFMPTPLAGRAVSPPRKPRVEGPSETADGIHQEEEIAAKIERPAGVLYGRSLLDVMAEKKILIKSQQKSFVAGKDGRRSMMEWKNSPAAQLHLVPEVIATTTSAPDEQLDAKPSTIPAVPRSRSAMSVFGPDIFYQRDLERLRIVEEEELRQRDEEDRKEAEMWEKEKIKEIQKQQKMAEKRISKLLKPRKGAGSSDLVQRESHAENDDTVRPTIAAPSLSLPAHFEQTGDKISLPWFETNEAEPGPAESVHDDTDDDVPLNLHRPNLEVPLRPSTFSRLSSESQMLALRTAVMQGTISAHEAAAESVRLGLGSLSTDSQNDERPLGERLTATDSYTGEYAAQNFILPPKLNLDLNGQGLNLNSQERQNLSGLQTAEEEQEVENSDDEKPLGLKFNQFDDLPLAQRAQMLNFQPPPLRSFTQSVYLAPNPQQEEDEDDLPLAFTHSNTFNQALQHDFHQRQFYQTQANSSQQAFLSQQNMFGMQQQQQHQPGYSAPSYNAQLGGPSGSMVERWRRGVES